MKKDISRSLLILSAEPRTLLPCEQFLGNRGWKVTVTGDEKTALSFLIERRPSFFMISVQHANKKTRTLHKLLAQTLPDVCVIYFAEHNNLETYRRLAQSEHPHRVHAPITGPGIERAVNKFLKETHERELQQELYLKSLSDVEQREILSWAPVDRGDDSLLSRGVGLALDFAVNKADGVVREPLAGKITNTACIVIESVRFSGYLIAAMAGDRPFDEAFVGLIRERLVQFLRENGEGVKDDESFPMKVREVEFQDWATDYAEFLKKSVHEGQEVAFAFFPVNEVAEHIGDSRFENMSTVRVEDLIAETEVDFGVHLFLPANQKFLLYTPKGSVFFAKQKDRLVKAGVKELHIKNEDLTAFKRYRARHRVEGLIRDFEERQKFLAG